MTRKLKRENRVGAIKTIIMKTLHLFLTLAATSFGMTVNAQQGVTKYGSNALTNTTNSAIYNSAFGHYALNANSTGTKNTAFGANVLRANNGNYNTGIGYASLYQNISGEENAALGHYSLFSNTSGRWNTALGTYALKANTTGFYNTAIGYSALFSNTDQSYNTAVGPFALYTNTGGVANTGVGYRVLYYNTSGGSNTGMGHAALYVNTTGSANNAFGRYALYSNTTGSFNNAFGYEAMKMHNTGSYNTAMGHASLSKDVSGTANTALGYSALSSNTTGNFNTTVGYGADVSFSNLSNATAIGYAAKVDASNKVRIGNASVTSIGGQVGWTIFSDGRYKSNVQENVNGLEFIKALRPVTYNLDVKGINAKLTSAEGSADETEAKSANAEMEKSTNAAGKVVYSGFIAQEVEAAAKKLNYEFSGVDKPQTQNGLYGLRYDNFIVPLVKAVQELAQQNAALIEDVKKLESKIGMLESKPGTTGAVSANPSNASKDGLEQNNPNPFNGTTVIRYHIPSSTSNAQLLVANANGVTVKTFLLNSKGAGQVSINAAELSTGSYFYTLLLDGKKTGARQMIIVK